MKLFYNAVYPITTRDMYTTSKYSSYFVGDGRFDIATELLKMLFFKVVETLQIRFRPS